MESGEKFAEGTLSIIEELPISEEELEEIKAHYELKGKEVVQEEETDDNAADEKVSFADKVKNIFKRKPKKEE